MNENLAEIIGQRIKATREKIDMSQKKLAEAVEVSPAAINQFEKGEKKPSSGVLARIAGALGTSADYLLGASEEDEGLFLNSKVAAAFRNFRELEKKDRDIIMGHIEYLRSRARAKDEDK